MFKKRIMTLIIFEIILLILISLGIKIIIQENNRVFVEGTIKKYNDSNVGIEYYIGEEKNIYKIIDSENQYKDGDTVEIAYQKDDQSYVEVSPNNAVKGTVYILGIIMFFVTLKANDYINYYKLPTKGEKVEVEYVDTIKVSDNYANFYQMKFKWTNPKDGKEYTFFNEEIKDIDPRILLKEKNITKFVAYVDKKDPSYHRVMLTNLFENTQIIKERELSI